MKEISIYGAGGHGHAAVAVIKSIGEYDPVIVYDDQPTINTLLDVPVKKYDGQNLNTGPLCITVGNNFNRKRIARKFDTDFPTFIHRSSVVYPSVSIDIGTLILSGVVLDAEVEIGKFCIINNHATVSHNVVVKDFVHIAIQAAIAGGVEIGEGTLIGAGSIILPEIKIGKWVTIGAGSVVTKNIPDNAVVFGNPAEIKKYNNQNEF